ncbi:MAG: type II toxin-antitoxin system RelB/DinJ family antitoxin [Pontiella sp.]|nr:type II toxin-antitoxin system RelB/DinJ family antitoxin [Pontiella sp.]MBT8046254.1 type II toxin-antitoxin system RelB/DinJ family antitoxin [Pontiella sp.]NNJ69908.1 type II toxin-antitoxin system RelB/DinJ family antitoxin [Kiritimatiellales bacterium]
MSKTAMVRARVEPELKQHAEEVFQRLGLNATQAITMFYKQVELREGLPFEIAIPTPATAKTFQATDSGKDLIICEDANDMFDKLGI